MSGPLTHTVVSAPAHTAYAGVSDLRDMLGIDAGDAAAAVRLNKFIDAASRLIDGYCGQTFARGAYRSTYGTLPASLLLPGVVPLVSVTSLTDSDGNDVSDYQFTADFVLLNRPQSGLDLEFEAGYMLPGSSAPDIPADLELAALEMARELYIRRSRSLSLESETVDGIADVSYSRISVPIEIRQLLDPYRRVGVGV